jgi:hypothetical protein
MFSLRLLYFRELNFSGIRHAVNHAETERLNPQAPTRFYKNKNAMHFFCMAFLIGHLFSRFTRQYLFFLVEDIHNILPLPAKKAGHYQSGLHQYSVTAVVVETSVNLPKKPASS